MAASQKRHSESKDSESVANKTFSVDDSNVTISRRRNPNLTLAMRSETEDPDEIYPDIPMYMAFATSMVTPSGFQDLRLKYDLLDKIQIMAGEVCHAYSHRTTHVLTAHGNTDTVKTARLSNIPVVSSEWVEKVWQACESGQNPYYHISLSPFKDDYMCPIFYKLRFMFSNRIDKESRRFYRTLIEDHGGKTTKLFQSSTPCDWYFYICPEPETDPAYLFAQRHRISCVTAAWISDSISRKALADVKDYEVRSQENRGFGDTYDLDKEDDKANPYDPGAYLGFERVDGDALVSPSESNTISWVEATIRELTADDDDVFEDSQPSLNRRKMDEDDETPACA